MREFIRHPSDIPINYQLGDVVSDRKDYLKNISEGGLCFRSSGPIEPGTTILIQIPLVKPQFRTRGVVVWCRQVNGHHDVGVRFEDATAKFRIRMVEQVCHIEQYKREVHEQEGRTLSSEEAALEWIRKYAADFPNLIE